jgi:integrase
MALEFSPFCRLLSGPWAAKGQQGASDVAIYKRVSGKTGKASWQVVIDRRDPVTGDRNRQTVGTFKTKKEAEKAERDALSQHERGVFVEPSTYTVGELLDAWLRAKRSEISEQSWKDYEILIRLHLKPGFGPVPVQRLTTARIQQQYGDWLDGGMSNRLVSGCHMRLKQALDFAVKQGLVAFNAAQSATPPKVQRKKPNVWDRDQVITFLEVANSDSLHPLWHLYVLEGLRRGEALGLRWKDLNWTQGTIHIQQTVTPDKNNRGRAAILPRTKTSAGARTVRLTALTLDALRDHMAAQDRRQLEAEMWEDHDLIVCTSKGTPINPNNVTRSFERLVKIAGLPRIRVHDLRHTSATMLLKQGVPPKVASERLGHATVSTTLDLYSHVLPDMQEDAARKITELLSEAPA